MDLEITQMPSCVMEQFNADDWEQVVEGSSSHFIGPEEKTLTNPVILSHIFAKLESEDQQQFRLVNRLWRDVTLDKFRKSVLIKFVVGSINRWGIGINSTFLQILPGGEHEIYRISEIPFRCFRLNLESTFGTRLGQHPLLDKFWEFFSPKMEHLELEFHLSTEPYLDTLKWILLEGGRTELKTLKISSCSTVYYPTSEAKDSKKLDGILNVAKKLTSLEIKEDIIGMILNSDSYRDLFKIIPNLKKLSLDWKSSQQALRALASPPEEESPLKCIKLEALKIDAEEKETLALTLDYLRTARPNLKELTIDHCYRSTTIRKSRYQLHQILSHCSSTLTMLKLRVGMPIQDHEDSWITEFSGRLFPELQELSLVVYDDNNRDLENGNDGMKFDFGAFCGMLKLKRFSCHLMWGSARGPDLTENDLKFRGRKTEWSGDEKVQDYQTLKLDKLEKFHFRLFRNFNESSLRKLATWTKHLKRLRLHLSADDGEEMLQLCLDLWPDLQEFKCLFGFGSAVPTDVIQQQQQRLEAEGKRSVKIVNDDYYN